LKVLHIADVHFRGGKRHEEYQTVFEKFFQEAREEKPDRIVIIGDIVHTKTQGITPELIKMLVWWFNEMAAIAPTIITLGNHDGLILNKSRLDAISPIIEALNNKNLIFLRDSVIHLDPDFNVAWCNFSCFDEEGWDKIVPVEGKTNIAFFHGAVRGAKTDSEWELSEGETDIGRFSKFDYGMFGDIHKCQSLDTNGKFNYCGSTIQQNFGESVDKGYLVWNIEDNNTWTVERKLLENPSPFVTVSWEGSIKSTLKECEKYKVGSRFRIASDSELLQEEFKQIAHFLKEKMFAAEITWKIEGKKDTGVITIDSELIEKESLRNQKTQVSLVKQYLKDGSLDENGWKVASSLIEKNLALLNEDESPRHTKWSIKQMKWENTFTYGKDNIIDFTKLNGVVGIFGKNRSGKSSIPGSLMYCLYNTTDRGPVKNVHVVNARKGHCSVEIDFSIDGIMYRVERITTKHTNRRGDTGAATNVNVYQLDSEGNNLVDLSGEQRRDSDKILRSLIGTSNDFLLTSFASQGAMNNFINENASARKTYLNAFLDLGIFDAMFKKIKQDSYELKGAMKSQKIDYEKLITDSTLELQNLEVKKKLLTKELKSTRELEANLTLVLATHKDKGAVTQSDVSSTEENIKHLQTKRENNKKKTDELIEDIEKSELRLKKITRFKESYSLETLKLGIAELNSMEKKEVIIFTNLEKENAVLKNQERSIMKLAEVPCSDMFPTCKFIKDSHNDKRLIGQQKTAIEELNEQLKNIRKQVENIREKALEEKFQKYNKILNEETALTLKTSSNQSERKLLTEYIKTADSKILELESALSSMKLRVIDSDVSTEVDDLKSKIYETQKITRNKESELSTIERNCGTLIGKIDNLVSDKDTYQKARIEWKLYEKLLDAYGKNGIPLMILATELPKINTEISKILQDVTGFTVSLVADPDNNDLEIYLDYGDSRRPIELGSGMEKMMSSLAIRVALINISSLPKTDILIVDEGFGALDDFNIEACNRLLNSLKRYFKSILVISHVDAIKDAVDGMIEIGKNGKDSHVCYI